MARFNVAVFDHTGQQLHVYPIVVTGEDTEEAVEEARLAALADFPASAADAGARTFRILPEVAA